MRAEARASIRAWRDDLQMPRPGGGGFVPGKLTFDPQQPESHRDAPAIFVCPHRHNRFAGNVDHFKSAALKQLRQARRRKRLQFKPLLLIGRQPVGSAGADEFFQRIEIAARQIIDAASLLSAVAITMPLASAMRDISLAARCGSEQIESGSPMARISENESAGTCGISTQRCPRRSTRRVSSSAPSRRAWPESARSSPPTNRRTSSQSRS